MHRIWFDKAKFQIDEEGAWLRLRIPVAYRTTARAFQREMKDTLYVAQLQQHRERRSLDANAYLWVLLEKIAAAIGGNKDEIYLEMLGRYGKFIHVIVNPAAVETLKREYRLVKELGEVTAGERSGIQCQCYLGSSSYNTAEMARLLDGVVQECRDLGIETETPEELARMKESWNAPNDKGV